MRMRRPGTIDQAIQAVRTLQNTLGNSRGLHDARKDAFLNWCEDQARPQLEHYFDPTEDLLAELESSYMRLALAPEMSLRRLNGMLNREFTAWDERLRRVDEKLQQQKKFVDRAGAPVVLDTSAFMEGKSFLSFEWHTLDTALLLGRCGSSCRSW